MEECCLSPVCDLCSDRSCRECKSRRAEFPPSCVLRELLRVPYQAFFDSSSRTVSSSFFVARIPAYSSILLPSYSIPT